MWYDNGMSDECPTGGRGMNSMVLYRLREALASRSVDDRVDALDLLVASAETSPELVGDVAAAVLVFLALADDFTAARAERTYDAMARRLGYPPLRAAAVGRVIPVELLVQMSELRFDLAIPGPPASRG
jgi:hypothetical protein